MQDNTQPVAAGFGPRAAAFLIDKALMLLAMCFVRIPAAIAVIFCGAPARSILFGYTTADVICYVLSAVYFILLTYFTGSTLGKKCLRIRVARADGAPLRLNDVAYRETVGRYLSGILCIGYFMVLVDSKKRAFHDYLCDTQVIYDDGLLHDRRQRQNSASTEGYTAPDAASDCGYTIPGEAPAALAAPALPAKPEQDEIQ